MNQKNTFLRIFLSTLCNQHFISDMEIICIQWKISGFNLGNHILRLNVGNLIKNIYVIILTFSF